MTWKLPWNMPANSAWLKVAEFERELTGCRKGSGWMPVD
jgi:hypothetical protein